MSRRVAFAVLSVLVMSGWAHPAESQDAGRLRSQCRLTWTDNKGDFSLSLRWRHLSGIDAESKDCPNQAAFQTIIAAGATFTSTSLLNVSDGSAGVFDPNNQVSSRANGTGGVFSAGVAFPAFDYFDLSGTWAVADAIDLRAGVRNIFDKDPPLLRYAPEDARKAYAASFPIKAPPKDRPLPFAQVTVEGNIYFFPGGEGHITGIPGGPFGTAAGSDSFTVRNNFMFTAGPVVNFLKWWNIGLTAGFAELNQTVKYNCSTFCAVAPATPAFTASQDKWVPGAYVGGRIRLPAAIPGLPAGTQFGIDYKHIFFANYNASLGNLATRVVNAQMTPNMDLVTVSLAIPIR